MKKLIRNFIILHTILFIVTGVGIWFILNRFFPSISLFGYSIVPLFFYVLGLFFICCLRRTSLDESNKMVNTYMMFRMIKIFVSLSGLIIYSILYKETIRSFAIVFLIFYIINLVWETYVFTQLEKYIKFKMEQNKPPIERINSDELED